MSGADNLARFYRSALCDIVSWHADARDVFPDWKTTASALAEIAECALRGEDWLSDSDGSPKGGDAGKGAFEIQAPSYGGSVHDSAAIAQATPTHTGSRADG